METTLKLRGGKRSNAGRKPITDRKIQLTIYPRQSEVDLLGGVDEVKVLCFNAITRKIKYLKK
jgi:hypothetical protein